MLQFGIRAKVSTLSLNGLDKWSLDPEVSSGNCVWKNQFFLNLRSS
jgi:hypothetical protein